MNHFKFILSFILFFNSFATADVVGTFFLPPALIEGFNQVTSAAGTTTLTASSETKQILTGTNNQTFVLPDATTLQLSRHFHLINKSSGTLTVQTSGGGALTTIPSGEHKEVHLRAAGSAVGTWDVLESAASATVAWGSVTGTLSAQTDLQAALDLKAPLASPTFTGTIGTPLTANRAMILNGTSQLAASTTTSTQIGYLDTLSGNAQTQIDGKQSLSTVTTKGDTYVATASGVTTRQAAGSDGTQPIYDSQGITGIRAGTPVGTDNYIKANPSFESNSVAGWTTYADVAGTAPVDCTGGSPNTTIAANNSAPVLNGAYQLLATLNSGATRQGEGFSYAFSIPTMYNVSPAMHQIEVPYAIASGTFVAGNPNDTSSAGDSTYTVWVYDVTNSKLIQPTTYRLYSNVGDRFVTTFQNNAGSTSYRLCVHKGTSATVASNITVKLDDIRIDYAKYAYGTYISDFRSCTFTGSWVSNTTYSCRVRTVGDSKEYDGLVSTSGAPTSANLTVNLPSGDVIDTSKLSGTNNKKLGDGTISDTGTDEYDTGVYYSSTTSVVLRVKKKSAGNDYVDLPTVTQAVPMTWANTDYVSFNFKAPISGLSSNSQQSDGYQSRLLAGTYKTLSSTTITSGTALRFTTLVEDKAASYNTSTGAILIPSAGTWELGIHGINAGAATDVKMFVGATDMGVVGSLASGTGRQSIIVQHPFLAGDSVTFVPQASNSATDTVGWISFRQIQGPTTISATEFVGMKYSNTAGTSFSGTFANVPFVTKEYDSHNGWNGTDTYTCPVAGYYSVLANINFAYGAYTAGHYVEVSAYRDGTRFYAATQGAWVTASNYLGSVLSTVVQCNAGQTLLLKIRNDASRSLETTSGFNTITITRIK